MNIYIDLVFNTLDQFKRSWYFFVFRMPCLPERLLQIDDYAVLKEMWDGKFNQNFTKEDLEAFKYAISRPGLLIFAFKFNNY